MGQSSPDIIYGRRSPDQICGQEFARQNIWARVLQINYIGERSPDKNIWVRVRPIKNMGESSPGQAYGRELASPNI